MRNLSDEGRKGGENLLSHTNEIFESRFFLMILLNDDLADINAVEMEELSVKFDEAVREFVKVLEEEGGGEELIERLKFNGYY